MALNFFRRADIVLTSFGPTRTGEADFNHPAIVITNNLANANAHVVVVVPITSNLAQIYKYDLELPLERSGLNKDSKAQTNLIQAVSTTRFIKKLGFVSDDLMLELNGRIREHLGL